MASAGRSRLILGGKRDKAEAAPLAGDDPQVLEANRVPKKWRSLEDSLVSPLAVRTQCEDHPLISDSGKLTPLRGIFGQAENGVLSAGGNPAPREADRQQGT